MPDYEDRTTQEFAEYIRAAARRAGYDIDSPRGGGRTALARDTGMSQSSVGRMLAGKAMPDPAYLEALATALRVPLPDLLVLSGLISREAFAGEAQSPRSVSPREAAADLGIKDPAKVQLFETMVRALLTDQNITPEERDDESGAA
ncbi:helix-turn-helix domain-containing protein [Streptomyces tendae]|uniref:helix-turn-helix domain-containing protein n=1 Tax=Streptomyces tendae TaxID=1932 RepID=UPI00380339E3